MLNWLLKKTRDPVVEISGEALAELKNSEKVSVVFYGSLDSPEGESIKQIAIADDYNSSH